MKLATGRYAVKIMKNGKSMVDGYYGYDTRKSAQERASEWEKIGYEATVIDRKKK